MIGEMHMASSFVYVSNAGDGDISTYRLRPDGSLEAGPRARAAGKVGPIAVSRDRRFLYAAARSEPYTLFVYAIEPSSGALEPVGATPLVGSLPFIALDRTGRFLLGASYGANLVTVNSVGGDGKVHADPVVVLPTGRNPHSIRADRTNRYVYVPHLGTDQIFQFLFDERTGTLTSNTPPLVQLQPGSGPRHFVLSADNRFVYLLSEMVGTVTTLLLDAQTGLLTERGRATALPPDTTLRPGAPRGAGGVTARNTDNDIWAADVHLTPDGGFLYASERTSSTLAGFRINGDTGELAYLGSTPTELQPRGFAIDPTGEFLIAAGERSDKLSSYAIDPASGALQLRGRYPAGQGGNWVEIV
jgi:6-phosphogluconolactonase